MHLQQQEQFNPTTFFTNAFADPWEPEKTTGEIWRQELRDRLLAKQDQLGMAITFASDHPYTVNNYELFESVIRDGFREYDRRLHQVQRVHRMDESLRTQYAFFAENKNKTSYADTILHIHGFVKFADTPHISGFERMKRTRGFWFNFEQLAFKRGLVRWRNRKNTQFMKAVSLSDKGHTETQIDYATKQQDMEENMVRIIHFGSLISDPS